MRGQHLLYPTYHVANELARTKLGNGGSHTKLRPQMRAHRIKLKSHATLHQQESWQQTGHVWETLVHDFWVMEDSPSYSTSEHRQNSKGFHLLRDEGKQLIGGFWNHPPIGSSSLLIPGTWCIAANSRENRYRKYTLPRSPSALQFVVDENSACRESTCNLLLDFIVWSTTTRPLALFILMTAWSGVALGIADGHQTKCTNGSEEGSPASGTQTINHMQLCNLPISKDSVVSDLQYFLSLKKTYTTTAPIKLKFWRPEKSRLHGKTFLFKHKNQRWYSTTTRPFTFFPCPSIAIVTLS